MRGAVKTRDARVVDYCSALLERYGANPIPPAAPDFRLPAKGDCQKCRGCGHPLIEHGATGECWHLADWLGPDCCCGVEVAA